MKPLKDTEIGRELIERQERSEWPRKPTSHELAKYEELALPDFSKRERVALKRAVIQASDSGLVAF